MTDLSLARIQFDANCGVQQDTDLITPVGLRVVCKHLDTFHRIPAHANTNKWSLHLFLLHYNLCWGHWFFPLPTPHPHQAPLPQYETCHLYIHPNLSITYTHAYTHTLKRLQQLKFIICHSLPPDKCHIFYFIYATISCSQSQSRNKLIHKTNETDGEVDKTGAENLQLLLQLILHKLHSNEQPYCAGVLTFNVRSFMTSSIFSSCCIKRSWNENKTDFINMHVPLWGTCADTSSTAKSTNPVKHLAKRQDR